GSLNDDKVLRQVARLGYGIVKAEAHASPISDRAHADHVPNDHEGHDHGHAEPGQAWWRTRRAALTLACAAALLAAYGI
ncbi:heavy metal translocating P-type ATPase, partial [Mesorhizobium sp. M7A.F.Ca.MR.148.00.0.0]